MGEAERRRREPSLGARGAEKDGCPMGERLGEGAVPSPEFFSIFRPQIATFGALWGYFYGSVNCFGRRQPLHDSIMSVTGVIAGS